MDNILLANVKLSIRKSISSLASELMQSELAVEKSLFALLPVILQRLSWFSDNPTVLDSLKFISIVQTGHRETPKIVSLIFNNNSQTLILDIARYSNIKNSSAEFLMNFLTSEILKEVAIRLNDYADLASSLNLTEQMFLSMLPAGFKPPNFGDNLKNEEFKSYGMEHKKANKIKRNLNIVVAGKSGVGKSSLLNYLVGEHVFETGVGEPVTQDYFNLREFKSDKDVLYKLYDTKGIEPDTTEEFTKNVKGKIDEFSESDDIFDHIHTLYYCIAATGKRLEPFEINFIKEIEKKLDVVIVLTKADLVKSEELQEMSNLLRKELDASEDDIATSIKIVRVCSIEVNTRKGKSVPFGREDILNHSFIGLWNTFAKTIGRQIFITTYFTCYVEKSRKEVGLSLLEFAEKQNLYYDDQVVELSLHDIFNLISIHELGFSEFLKDQRRALLEIFEGIKAILNRFEDFEDAFNNVKADLEILSKDILDFYAEIYGRPINTSVPLNLSKRKIDELQNFLIEIVKPFIAERIEYVINALNSDTSDDGWWSRLGNGDSREHIAKVYYLFNEDANDIKYDIEAKINSFKDTCSSELQQYGVLKLKSNKNEELEQKLSEIYLENEKNYLEEVMHYYSDDEIIDEKERAALERFRIRCNIPEERAHQIEEGVKAHFKL